jgi:SAM-dependent methyltransferase
MKENKYDDNRFFEQYSQMNRSVNGLQGAGEWHALQKMLPDLLGKRILDLGCGFGWHCRYAVEHGATSVLGIDLSEKMLDEAKKRNGLPQIDYQCVGVEDFQFTPDSFDVVISSLAFHYLESFDDVCHKINHSLTKDGTFVFSAEHPIFTAYGNQDWYYDELGNRLHWPVDRYFEQGPRQAVFLGEGVTKYHKTLTNYISSLLKVGFEITGFVEPEPNEEMLKTISDMKDELRRPMMFIVSAVKRS